MLCSCAHPHLSARPLTVLELPLQLIRDEADRNFQHLLQVNLHHATARLSPKHLMSHTSGLCARSKAMQEQQCSVGVHRLHVFRQKSVIGLSTHRPSIQLCRSFKVLQDLHEQDPACVHTSPFLS